MKKLLGMILTLALAAGLAWPVYAESSTVPPEVTAHAYLVMDAQTGQVLVQKGGAERNYPASITKIMTLALAMEKCGGDMTQQVTVSPDAVYSLEAGSSHVALQPGEVVSLNDLFHATILASANDAANVLAEYTAGSMEAFVELMNAKAAELGLAGTHFVNANGLHSADHYTTPYDMARLTQWAMTVPGFSELFGATSYAMQPTNKQEQERLFGTDNCMLVTNKYQYEGTTGGKSGWTEEAGYTMVETVTRSGRSLICVVMGSAKKYDKFSDSIALLDYCFDHFTPVTLAASDITSPQVPVYYAEGAPSVGSAPLALSEEGYTFLLHSALAADDVQVTFDTPERYMVDEPFAAAMTVSLRDGLSAGSCMNREIGVYTLGIDESAVSALLDANAKEFVDRPAWWEVALKVLGVLFCIFLLLAALVAGRIAYVAYVKAQRKKRRLARRRAAMLAAQQGLMPRVQQPRPVHGPAMTREPAPALRVVQGGRAEGVPAGRAATGASRGRD